MVDAFEGSKYGRMSFLDLSKAFDCVSYSILVRKLYFYNIHPSACGLLTSYLTRRQQCVKVNGVLSELGCVDSGVPQGSILGVMLFLVFINDLADQLGEGNVLLYADDTTLLSADCDLAASTLRLEGLRLVADRWFASNRLVQNREKTIDLMCTLRTFDEPAGAARFLGIYVDRGLTWGEHCDFLSRRLASACFLVRRLSETVSQHVLRVAYFSLVQSNLLYGILLWGHSASAASVFRLQRRILRILGGLDYRADCRSTFVRMGIMTLPSLFILESLKYVIANESALVTHGDVHQYNTRSSGDVLLPGLRLERSRYGPNYYGIKLYNAIDISVRRLPPVRFLNKIKTHLKENAFYSIEEFIRRPPLNVL